MKFHLLSATCRHCNSSIEQRVLEYSIQHFNFELCIHCQQWVEHKLSQTNRETICLYLSLIKRSVPATLQQFDGNKTINIALLDARVKVDACDPGHCVHHIQDHFLHPQQTFYVYEKGYCTFSIPGCLVKDNLEHTADYITGILTIRHHAHGSPR